MGSITAPRSFHGRARRVAGRVAVATAFAATLLGVALPATTVADPFANLGSFGTPNGAQGGQLSFARGVAVNRSGDGAPAGSVYVAEDFPNNRISQFSASGAFIRTWGFDVVDGVNHPGAPNNNGTGFEICDVTAGNTANQCKAGVFGSAAGQLSGPSGIAVDQSNGYLYVPNADNRRVDVFSGTGQFAGAFGYDVRPADPNPSGPDFCTMATGCQAAAAGGGGAGRFGTWNVATPSRPAVDPSVPGRVYVPDTANLRVSQYETSIAGGVLTGASFVKVFGSDVVSTGPGNRTVGRGERQEVAIAGGFSFSCFCFAPITGGSFTLSFDPDAGGATPAQTTGAIPYNASAAVVEQHLEDDLASIATNDVSVTGGPGPDAPWSVDFGGVYAGTDVAEMTIDFSGLQPSGDFSSVTTTSPGGAFPAGYEVCAPADGDVCKAGISGSGPGEFTSGGSPSALAVDSTGAIYATSGPLTTGACSAEAPCRIQRFAPDVSSATDFGPSSGPSQLKFTSGDANAVAAINLAVNPANDHVFVLRKATTTTYRVLEYDSAGNHLETHPAGAALSSSSAGTVSTGIAVGPTGRVYANYGGAGGGQVLIIGPVDPPTATIAPPTGVGTTSATFNGTVTIPSPGSPTFTTKYHFEYSHNGVDWTAVPIPDTNVADGSTGTHVVTQSVTGLSPNTLYSVRVVATTGPSATSPTVSFTTGAAPPRVASTFVDRVTQNGARLGAHIDPEGLDATYHFEWGSQPCSSGPNACAEVPMFERQIGNGNKVVIANETISGLEQASIYHYRVVATNGEDEAVGPDQTFETLNSCNLTGGRCYEMVSPPDKGPVGAAGDYVALAQDLRAQAAEDRPAIAYTLAYGLPDGTAGDEAVFQATRTDSGWSSKQLEAPAVIQRDADVFGSNTSTAKGLSRNLECGVFSSFQPLGGAPPNAALQAGATVLYSRHESGVWNALTDIAPTNPLGPNRGLTEFEMIGMSQDQPCERVVFRSMYLYPGTDGAGPFRLYWWEDGILGYVGVIPGPCTGGACVAQAVPGAALSTGTTSLESETARNYQRAVSEDGSRVFFTSISQQGGDTSKQAVFVRDRGSAMGTDVSQSQTGSLPGGTANNDDAVYQTAAVDGSKVFFLGRYGLASNSASSAVQSSTGPTACADSGTGCDLYEYDVASGKLTDLSVPGPDTENAAGAGVVGVLAADDDGSHVYFAARGQLVAGQGSTEASNLAEDTYSVYLAHGGSFSYVGQIDEARSQVVSFNNTNGGGRFGQWSSRVTPSGDRLVFESRENITDYDAQGQVQAYLYDEASDETVCVSCRRDGQPPTAIPADAKTLSRPLLASEHTESPATAPQTLSDDGRRVFFVSHDDLATGATEGRENLYQWEDGQVSFLASSGPTSTNFTLRFGGASSDGDDVYFVTVDKYTWQDHDGKLDVYDARVGGGFVAPPSPEPPCDPLANGGCQRDGDTPAVESPVETETKGSGNAPSSRARFSVGALSARQRRALVSGRRVNVRVRVTAAGQVSVRGAAGIGGFRVTVISASQTAGGAGVVEVPVRLSNAARRRIARTGSLAVTLSVRLSGARRATVRTLHLGKKHAVKRKADIRRSAGYRAAIINGRAGK